MDKKNKVSIIIPVYNASKYLDKCIESLINQSYKKIEIIIIDDGSTDNSLEIIQSYASENDNIRYYSQNNQGVSSARNKGISLSSGEYIFFIDADDWVEREYIEKMVENVGEDTDFVYCDWIIESKEKNIIDSVMKYGFNNSEEASELLEFYIINRAGCAPWGKLFKKSIIDKNKIRFLKNLPIAEDYLFIINYLTKSNKIKYVSIPMIHYNCNIIGANKKIRFDYVNLQFSILNELENILEQSGKLLSENIRRSYEISKLKIYSDMIFYMKKIYINKDECINNILIISKKIRESYNINILKQSDINVKEKIIIKLAYKNYVKLIYMIIRVKIFLEKHFSKGNY